MHTPLGAQLRQQPATAPLAETLEAIAGAGLVLAEKLRRARLEDVIGEAGAVNVQGEAQQKLDVLADELLLEKLSRCSAVAAYASEEQARPRMLRADGRYCVLCDPLDGSSNIDVAVPVGTIFGVLPCGKGAAPESALLQPGRVLLCAGYLLYGSSTALVLASAAGVDLFVLDPGRGEFLLAQRGLRMPAERKIYSINEANINGFDGGLQRWLHFAHENGYGARYIGSMVADVHRTLLRGGVFLYPATAANPQGKLRLLYECNPMASVMERAGGAATDGAAAILDIAPEALHQRCPVILGSSAEVARVCAHLCAS
ncbi:MAG: fructose-1,6-bisphosphatase [Deltaproteobacteria bacterium]|nr:fructose-1,6-bisphosphatase [Deltaproteobacteria bacterium]